MKLTSAVATVFLGLETMAAAKPLAVVPKYDGKFTWIKLASVPAKTLQTLGAAKSIVLDISFPRDVSLKKDPNGNAWFTFVIADQGSDWKWHQTSSGGVPVSRGTIKAGRYAVSIPVEGLPASVRKDKQQAISLGPNTSGLAKPVSFTIEGLTGK